ncbi:MBL fold metallo-hydrolase [Terracidiphilus gabretensis]|uniref:MBL fold metallo-hydrolase n=1 Tax=Terracidiphilus gabretensis TaxID=1577687 RepID=UPI00071B2F1C|nr:MBL fold metallo-hydrolase [Terracidiphilus gabretensis]
MRKLNRFSVLQAVSLLSALVLIHPSARVLAQSREAPGCEKLTAAQCVGEALTAMGGRDRLAALKSVRLDVIGHTELMEQSYRQDPFITSYERDKVVLDLVHQRMLENQHSVWPESDPGTAESDLALIATPNGGVYHVGDKFAPCSLADIDTARQELALGPERLLLNASAATDLHYEAPKELRSTMHTTVSFRWNSIPVRILINRLSHLPDAVETVQQFNDFWYYWGDVRQVVYWENWNLNHGIRYPTNQVIERNGKVWNSMQALNVEFNVPIEEKDFAMDAKAAQQSAQAKGWDREFDAGHGTELAPGVEFFEGSWNATLVKQDDGVIVLESPISSSFTAGLFAEAGKRYPGVPIKAVLSTSDSWPHVGGIRYDVAQGATVYIRDLNQPLLDRMLGAPHTIHPDALEQAKRAPRWHVVSGKTEIGSGDNRLVLYPLGGPATERQYMVYFPEHRLLYASDTLVVNPDHTLYDPEMMHEVKLAVEREHLVVDKVYSMHQGLVDWKEVALMLEKAST